MSNHKTPLTKLEKDGLIAHGLGRHIGKPSQLADVFRQGVAWALAHHPAPTHQPLTDDTKDAERYRWLRKNRDVLLLTGFFGNGCLNRGVDEVDAEIDSAIKADHGITGSKT